jgi:hypothetical protein
MSNASSPRDWYRRQFDERSEQLAQLQRRDLWLTRSRVATFLPAIVLTLLGFADRSVLGPCLLAAALFVAAFILVVRIHERLLRQLNEVQQRLAMHQTQLARLERRWSDVPPCPVELSPGGAVVANDLDLFGHASLFHLISQAHTPFGRETLRDWLLTPASPSQIVERQQAVAHLAGASATREEIDLRGRLLGSHEAGTRAFVDWAEEPGFLATRPWLLAFARCSSITLLLTLVAGLAGVVSAATAFLAIAAIAAIHLLLLVVYGGRVYDSIDRVASRNHDIHQYHPLFEIIASLPAAVPYFAKLHASMGSSPREPLDSLAGLARLVRFANLRRDGLSGLPYYISQPFLLTDFHVLALMERWKRQHGAAVRRWLQAVGELEAIASLSTLAHDEPLWSMPNVDDGSSEASERKIVGRELGHPLLADPVRVSNDVEIGPAGSFVLVTGSNMSGKSTLLRAVGLNVILAQAGAPVCAAELRLPPIEIATSMRTRDSLADGVSFFLAELRRLKEIVDQSRECQQHGRTLFYLLDEILQGTNSAERHIAVLRVIRHLVDHGSIGMVSTHDLDLARSPELTDSCRSVHLRETISTADDGTERMTFDYTLRPGVAPTTNALKLLKFVGLDE